MKSVTGIIKEEKECNGDAYRYVIVDNTKKRAKTYTAFNNFRIILHYNITVEYEKKPSNNPKFPDTRKIMNVHYNSIIKDEGQIYRILHDEIGLTTDIIDQLINKYQEKTMETMVQKLDEIIQFLDTKPERKKNEIIHKIKLYLERDIISRYTNFFNEYGIKYQQKWYNELQKTYMGLIIRIENKPYDLLQCGVAFDNVDKIGLALKFDKHIDRTNAIIKQIFKYDEQRLYLTVSDITNICQEKKIKFYLDLITAELLCVEIKNETYYTTAETYYMERYIENFCESLMRKKIIRPKQNYIGYESTTPEQTIAIKKAINNNISIITGAPGTGKTFTASRICQDLNYTTDIILEAPTGAAVCKIRTDVEKYREQHKNPFKMPEYMTIQAFVTRDEYQKKEYRKNNGKKKVTIFIDEMSMVDLKLFYKFVKIIEKYNYLRLILLGDNNQLPSIKGGNVLGDLIASGKIPTTVLTINKRSEKNPEIMEGAKKAINGETIIFHKKLIFIQSNRNEIEKKLKECIDEHKITNDNSCIIVPQRRYNKYKSNICTDSCNEILQNVFNKEGKVIYVKGDKKFRENDKLIQRKNMNKKDTYNGSILTCKRYEYKKIIKDKDKNKKIQTIRNSVEVSVEEIESKIIPRLGLEYDHKMDCIYHLDETNLKEGENKTYNRDEMEKLELGYALTVHSAQGKGYQNIIIIMNKTMFSGLLTRKTLYTAITRSIEKCIIISDEESLERCKSIDKPRITTLFKHHVLGKMTPLMTIGLNISSHIDTNVDYFTEYLLKIGINAKKIRTLSSNNKDYVTEMKKLFKLLMIDNDLLLNTYFLVNEK